MKGRLASHAAVSLQPQLLLGRGPLQENERPDIPCSAQAWGGLVGSPGQDSSQQSSHDISGLQVAPQSRGLKISWACSTYRGQKAVGTKYVNHGSPYHFILDSSSHEKVQSLPAPRPFCQPIILWRRQTHSFLGVCRWNTPIPQMDPQLPHRPEWSELDTALLMILGATPMLGAASQSLQRAVNVLH